LQYEVQTSTDNLVWKNEQPVTTPATTFPSPPGPLYVRVAAILAEGPGPWKTGSITIKEIPGITAIIDFDTNTQWEVTWNAVLGATDYTVKVYNSVASALILERTATVLQSERVFNYDLADATADGNVVREMVVEVTPRYVSGNGAATQLELKNSIPPAPTGLGHTLQSENPGVSRTYRLAWTNPEHADLHRVRVWSSGASGFTPGTPTYENTAGTPGHLNVPEFYDLVVPLSGGAHAAVYWRVAVYDVWGNELTVNLSSEQTIPAYP
jgi:hypothetical protein